MTDKTYKTYNVEARGVIKLWMDVEASSQEEAEALADQVKERMYGEPGPWRPLADGYTLEITSVREETPPKLIQIPKRDFDPAWDD